MNLHETSGRREGDLYEMFDPERLKIVSEHPIVQCAVGLILTGEEEPIPIVESLEPTLIRMARKHGLEGEELAAGFLMSAIQLAQDHARARKMLDAPNMRLE